MSASALQSRLNIKICRGQIASISSPFIICDAGSQREESSKMSY